MNMKDLRLALIFSADEGKREVEICSLRDSTLANAVLSLCIDRSERSSLEGKLDEGGVKELRIMNLIRERLYRECSRSGSPGLS